MSKEIKSLKKVVQALGASSTAKQKNDVIEEIADNIGPTGAKLHICTATEYDAETGVPTITDPDEGTFYLVPDSDTVGNLYKEYFYTGTAWELFGTASSGAGESDIFWVTVTDDYDSEQEKTVYTSSATLDEIVAAYEDEKYILAKLMEMVIPLNFAADYGAMFGGFVEEDVMCLFISEEGVEVFQIEYISEETFEYTFEHLFDNGLTIGETTMTEQNLKDLLALLNTN